MKGLFTRISKPKKVLNYAFPSKRYNILKFEFLLFLVSKWQEIQFLKRYIFWVDRHILKLFSVLRSLWKDLSNNYIRYPILAKLKFGAKFVTSFSRQKCQNLKNKKHRILENGEFFFGAKFQNNWIKSQEIIQTRHFRGHTCPMCNVEMVWTIAVMIWI